MSNEPEPGTPEYEAQTVAFMQAVGAEPVPMTDPRDRDDPPGVRMTEEAKPPMLVDFVVESAAAHSRSQGWLPVITLQLTDEEGTDFRVFVPVGPELIRIVDSIGEAGRRAILDAQAAQDSGITVPHEEGDDDG